jgi:hypothetical protein
MFSDQAIRATVLPALVYGRAKVVEAKIDHLQDFVRKLGARDIVWLRENEAKVFVRKAERLSEELRALASVIGGARIEDKETEAACVRCRVRFAISLLPVVGSERC